MIFFTMNPNLKYFFFLRVGGGGGGGGGRDWWGELENVIYFSQRIQI